MASQQRSRLLHSGVCQPELISQISSNLQSPTSADDLTSLRRIFGMVSSLFFARYYMGCFFGHDGSCVGVSVLDLCHTGRLNNPAGLVYRHLIFFVCYIPCSYQVLYYLVEYVLYRGQPGSYPSSSQSSLVCLEYSYPPWSWQVGCRTCWLRGFGYL